MRNFIFPLLILFSWFNINAQIVSVSPNHTKRGVTLSTTITPYSNSMSISSGTGSQYNFWLQKGTEIINASSYFTFTSSGLGWATAAHISIPIPISATPGFYDLHITNPLNYWWGSQIKINAVEILETLISGQVFFDANQNGTLDTNENGISGQKIIINPGGSTLYTGLHGVYNAIMDAGTFNTSLNVPSGFTLTSSPSLTVTVPPDTSGNNFGIYTPPSGTLLHDFFSSSDPFRCLRPSNAVWSVTSMSNNVEVGTITMILDSSLTYLNSSRVPTFTGNDTVRWNYVLDPFQSITTLVTLQGSQPGIPVNVYLYDSLYDNAGHFDSLYPDTIASNVLCSQDPNDITASPFGTDSVYHYVSSNETMTYRIRFQNCGTDTAYNISIRNWIDPDLDLNTFQLEYSSFPASVQFESNRTLRYMFNNIMLPDSNVDELNSHGMVVYSIKPNANIPNNTAATNNAYIYFDNNPAVVTNLVWNYFTSPTTEINIIKSNEIFINPLPVQDYSIMAFPDNRQYKLIIYDVTGRQIINDLVAGTYILNSDMFYSGVFFYQLISNSTASYTGKFVVVH